MNLRITNLLFVNEYESARVLLALSSVFWSSVLLGVDGVFSDTSYSMMTHLGSQYFWAFLFAMNAALGLTSVLYELPNQFARFFVPLLGFVLWGSVSVCMVASPGDYSPAIGSVLASTVIQWWILVRIKSNEL